MFFKCFFIEVKKTCFYVFYSKINVFIIYVRHVAYTCTCQVVVLLCLGTW